MNNTKKFARAARFRHVTAAIVTILFHVALFAAVTYGTDEDYERLIPDTIKEWLKMEAKPEGKTPVAYNTKVLETFVFS
ncbi:MAG: hypothetical protein ACI9XO_000770 [Paraglaciecola sp.]|jgi:hypothetical protein